MRAPARAVAYATDAPTIPRPTMARSCCVVTPWTVSDGADPVPLDSPTRGHIVAAMSRHAVVTHPAVPSRSEAVPHRRLERDRIRSGSGTLPGDVRKPSEFGPAPAAKPGRLQRLLVGLRVLVVDDDPDVLELFAVTLTACGADVTTVDNARDALALATQTRPHAVVSDIAMIGEDGYWLVRGLERLPHEQLADVPVIPGPPHRHQHPPARVPTPGVAQHLPQPLDPELLCRLVASGTGR